ncbi:indolethylamine N-methyltransferase-like [Mixophyes fleayi]|uniref:indolethylamine N-methyltransferase-like n=1 Tax=Mixophyes fleayi TaxID=3061075 RepID=UPI003F4DD295
MSRSWPSQEAIREMAVNNRGRTGSGQEPCGQMRYQSRIRSKVNKPKVKPESTREIQWGIQGKAGKDGSVHRKTIRRTHGPVKCNRDKDVRVSLSVIQYYKMDCRSHKFYHVGEFDSRMCVDMYFSDKPDMVFADDSLKFPMRKLHQVFSAGEIKGDTLIDISFGTFIHHLHSACDFFKDIYSLKFSERCIMELSRWLNTCTGALDWNHTLSYATALDGNSDQCEDKAIKLKMAIKKIVKCDIKKENFTDLVVLPQADCVISAWLLDHSSKDQDEYITTLKRIGKFIKPGGHLILFGLLNATYYMVGEDRFHVFNYDENFVRKVLTSEGFIVKHCEVHKRTPVSDLIDYKSVLFITAQKEE